MSIEHSQETKLDYRAIGRAYGYKAAPGGFEENPAVNMNIDWETGVEQRMARQRNAMKKFNTAPLHQSAENKRRQEALLDTAKIRTVVTKSEKDEQTGEERKIEVEGSLNLTTEKWSYGNDAHFLRLYLTDEQTGAEVGQYISAIHGNVWDMHDRITSEAYRGKYIGSQMIKATENCVQAVANLTGQDQEIVAEAAQLPVLSLFLNNGYEVVEEDKQRFAEVMSKLEAGDPHYVLASCEADFKGNHEERKTWYVFERAIYELHGDQIWGVDQASGKSNNMKYGVRFKLHKKIEANSDDVAAKIAQVREQTSSVS